MAAILAKAVVIAAAHGQVWDAEVSPPSAAGRLGGDVEHPEPEQLRFRLRQGGVVVQGQELEPAGEVGGQRGDLGPDGVDLEVARREPAQTGVFGDPDPVLDPSVGPVAASRWPSCPVVVLVTKAWYR